MGWRHAHRPHSETRDLRRSKTPENGPALDDRSTEVSDQYPDGGRARALEHPSRREGSERRIRPSVPAKESRFHARLKFEVKRRRRRRFHSPSAIAGAPRLNG